MTWDGEYFPRQFGQPKSVNSRRLSRPSSETQGGNWPHFSTCNFACHCQEWDIFFASSIHIFFRHQDKVLWCQDLLKTEYSELHTMYEDDLLCIRVNSPTTMRTLVWVAVWKSGASPDTSHLNLPLVVRSTFLNTILVSVDLYSWNKEVSQEERLHVPLHLKGWPQYEYLCFKKPEAKVNEWISQWVETNGP